MGDEESFFSAQPVAADEGNNEINDIKSSSFSDVPQSSNPALSVGRWKIIYPNYIDSSKTIQQGRRISRSCAVDSPRVEEMKLVCDHLRIPCMIEMKAYPRDWLVPGRLRLKLHGDYDEPISKALNSKKALMLKLGELIPLLKSRVADQSKTAASAKAVAQTSKKSARTKQLKKQK